MLRAMWPSVNNIRVYPNRYYLEDSHDLSCSESSARVFWDNHKGLHVLLPILAHLPARHMVPNPQNVSRPNIHLIRPTLTSTPQPTPLHRQGGGSTHRGHNILRLVHRESTWGRPNYTSACDTTGFGPWMGYGLQCHVLYQQHGDTRHVRPPSADAGRFG